jgi:hypothetical protein
MNTFAQRVALPDAAQKLRQSLGVPEQNIRLAAPDKEASV